MYHIRAFLVCPLLQICKFSGSVVSNRGAGRYYSSDLGCITFSRRLNHTAVRSADESAWAQCADFEPLVQTGHISAYCDQHCRCRKDTPVVEGRGGRECPWRRIESLPYIRLDLASSILVMQRKSNGRHTLLPWSKPPPVCVSQMPNLVAMTILTSPWDSITRQP